MNVTQIAGFGEQEKIQQHHKQQPQQIGINSLLGCLKK